MKRLALRWWVLAATAVVVIVLVGAFPSWWREWGSLVAVLATAGATVVLVAVTEEYVRGTRDLVEQSERQAILASLPVMVLQSNRGETVVVKNRGAPAMNVELRVLNQAGPVTESRGWQWVDAVMANGADSKGFPLGTGGLVTAQVRFFDRLGTTFLVERRGLGGSADQAYRVFRLRGHAWESLSSRGSLDQPIDGEGALLPPVRVPQ